jgi:hypothetical protein
MLVATAIACSTAHDYEQPQSGATARDSHHLCSHALPATVCSGMTRQLLSQQYRCQRPPPTATLHPRLLQRTQCSTAAPGPWSAVTVAQSHHMPWRLLNDLLVPGQEAGVRVATAASPDHDVPGCAPASITPWPLLQALRHHGAQALDGLIALYDPLPMLDSRRTRGAHSGPV